ncbi:MAG: YlmH/Sll1252 family protein, partial [Eisenbergiella sp.]
EALKISPLLEKFADNFTLRDFLGAVMNLGIDRSTVGDIFLEGRTAFLYCTQRIAPYICENMNKVKHTSVRCERVEEGMEVPVREPEKLSLIVSSERVDAVLAKLWQLSRNQSLELFRTKKVFVNGRLCENNSCPLKNGDMVSARGYGRFLYYGAIGETKKGRLNVSAGVYR